MAAALGVRADPVILGLQARPLRSCAAILSIWPPDRRDIMPQRPPSTDPPAADG